MTIWPFIIVRKSAAASFNETTRRHEEIHGCQQKEMLLVLFFVWYVLEYLVRLCQYRKHATAYRNISFEREAYDRQNDVGYPDQRRYYAWMKYL